MFDLWLDEAELTRLTLLIAVTVLLPLQLLLCCRVRSRLLRLLPALALGALAVVFLLLAAFSSGWVALGYAMFAALAALMLLMCGAGWGLWALIRRGKRAPCDPE